MTTGMNVPRTGRSRLAAITAAIIVTIDAIPATAKWPTDVVHVGVRRFRIARRLTNGTAPASPIANSTTTVDGTTSS